MYIENSMLNGFPKIDMNHLYKDRDMAICLLDISNTKFYNFMFGYECGDRILEIILNKVQSEINDFDHVYWLRGHKLLILLDKISSKDEAVVVIEKILHDFKKPIDFQNQKLIILLKIGISLLPNDSKDINEAFKYAEIALYYSNNIETYSFFKPEMYKNIIKKATIELDILNAINNNEFTVYYQAQIDMHTRKVYGMEALLRWDHPIYGIISPAYFIEITEQNGMINNIGKFVFKQACLEIKKLLKLGYENLSISINVSYKQFEEISFFSFIKNTLYETSVDPHSIILEITESVLINSIKTVSNTLIQLRNIGIKIFIDDFGMGYSSINYLRNLPVDGIKIDKSFIDKIHYSEKDFSITKNIIKLAQDINVEVVAEGVEKKEQLNCLESINCNKIQGYIFSKPQSADEFSRDIYNINKKVGENK